MPANLGEAKNNKYLIIFYCLRGYRFFMLSVFITKL